MIQRPSQRLPGLPPSIGDSINISLRLARVMLHWDINPKVETTQMEG